MGFDGIYTDLIELIL